MFPFIRKMQGVPGLVRLLSGLYNSNFVRILVLLALTAYAYHPFFTENNMGNRDAQFYQYMLHDALIQFQNGYFPCYVGQSEFSPLGTPCINAPMYLFFGIFLNFITFGELSPLLIQHLTIFFSAFLAAIILYTLIRILAPNLKWQAVFIAFLYISCPAIMALPYSLDAYLSFMAIPFIPIVFYGAIQIYRKNRLQDYVLVSVAFACLLMAHAPITFWILLLFGPFLLIIVLKQSNGIYKLGMMSVIFLGLILWQVIAILAVDQPMLSSDNGLFVPQVVLDRVIQSTLVSASDALKPLGWGKSELSFVQLGYGWWALILVSMVVVLKRAWAQEKLNYIFLAEFIVLGLFIFPISETGNLIWRLLPNFLLKISSDQITMRLYPILAAISAIFIAINLEGIKKSPPVRSKLFFNFFLGLIFVWSTYEMHYFLAHGNKVKAANASTQMPANSWKFSENFYSLTYGLPTDFLLNGFTMSNISVDFLSAIRDEKYQKIIEKGNEAAVLNRCFSSTEDPLIKNLITLGAQNKINIPTIISEFVLSPNSMYLLCIDQDSEVGKKVFYQVLDSQARERVAKELPVSLEADKNQKIILPVYIQGDNLNNRKDEKLQLRLWSSDQPIVKLNKIGLVKELHPTNYPLKILSQTPYIASIQADNHENFLEIIKLYKPGYEVTNNDQKIQALESERHTILVPLKKNEKNTIRIAYKGTELEQITLLIGGIFWLVLALYLLISLGFSLKNECQIKDPAVK